MAATNFYEQILAAVRGVGTVTVNPNDPDPPTSPPGTSVVNNWRSRTSSPSIDGSTGKRFWLVPAGREWQLMGISATLQTSSTAGSRQVEIWTNPGENDVTVFRHRYPAAVQAPSLTYTYNFSMGSPLLTAAVNNFLSAPLPPVILQPTSIIGLWDKAQIAPSTDTWSNVNLLVLERVIA